MALTVPLSRPMPELVVPMVAAGTIVAADVLKLRREVFTDGVVDREEAELLFYLNERCRDHAAPWNDFFVDALTDYFIWQRHPKGYLADDDAGFLIEGVTRDGRIDGRTELELLVNVVHWAHDCPEPLVLLALDAVKRSVIEGGGLLFGSKRRRPGVIDRADVEIVRKLIYAGGGAGGFTVTRAEADMLFDLNDATIEKANVETWAELFVHAVAAHVMFPRGAPVVPDADEVRRREAWLKDRRGIGRLLGGIGGAVVRGKLVEGWQNADLFGVRAGKAQAERERTEAAEAERRQAVDAAEAAWLVQRIGRDGIIHDNERALLAFIKAHATTVDVQLAALFEPAGV
ncbi:MAG: hypothetical protein ACFCUO_10525 [Rhodospirillales bacterium]